MAEVLEAVVLLATTQQDAANRILELLLGGTDWYLLDYSRDAIRALLEAVIEACSEAQQNRARALVHALGEKGIHGMQDLL